MSLAGTAFLALWNDIAAAREAEYDRWHTEEHVPERVAVRGINGARRYVNRTRATHRYFTLYELDALEVLESAEYTDLLRHPTPWSAAMRPDFANFVRAPFRVERSEGAGIGAAVAVLAYQRQSAHAASRVLDTVRADAGVVAAHAGAGSIVDVTADWRTGARPDTALRAFDAILLIEALDRGAAAQALQHARAVLDVAHLPADFGADVYDLAFAFPGHGPDARARFRRPQWNARAPAE